MNRYIKQHIFDEKNVKLFFLSPYTDTKICDDKIIFMRMNSNDMLILPCEEIDGITIVNQLMEGIEEDKLRNILSAILKEESEEWLCNGMLEGILE